MTPSEMREAAERLREGRLSEQGAWRTSDIEAGADALDRLAGVTEHAEKWEYRPPTSPYTMGLRDAWRTILRIGRGNTTNHENRNGQ